MLTWCLIIYNLYRVIVFSHSIGLSSTTTSGLSKQKKNINIYIYIYIYTQSTSVLKYNGQQNPIMLFQFSIHSAPHHHLRLNLSQIIENIGTLYGTNIYRCQLEKYILKKNIQFTLYFILFFIFSLYCINNICSIYI